MRYLYEADLADTAPYDVVVNSEKLRYEAAVESLLSRR
jgi:cytidylate kinase